MLSPAIHTFPRPAKTAGFTLPELLIAVSIFAMVATITGSMYIQAFRETRKTNLQNQIYEDGRFLLQRIADEIRAGMIDYDEYYNQNVVIGTLSAQWSIPGAGTQNFGQNYGRYYSAFFNPGSDNALGFDCNTADLNTAVGGGASRDEHRNKRTCTPLRKTIDRNTGENPFSGKYTNSAQPEDAFCGAVLYSPATFNQNDRKGLCQSNGAPDSDQEKLQKELYLISADAFTKTIIARERIGGTAPNPVYALSLLRLKGEDTNNDSIPDRFTCSAEFQCFSNASPCTSANLPRIRTRALLHTVNNDFDDQCDTLDNAFSKDFVPMSPFSINVKDINFFITPAENPHYAFAEDDMQEQPLVTIVLTVEQNTAQVGVNSNIPPITFIATVSPRTLAPIPAPLLVR